LTLDSIDLTLWIAGASLEAALFVLVIWKRIYRTLPIFSCYLIWCLLSDAGLAVALLFPHAYLPATLVGITMDALLQMAILAELGRVVVRHNQVSPPSRTVIVLLTILGFVIAGSLNTWTFPTNMQILDMLYVVMLQLFAVLRVVFLLTLVWWSSLQKLKWPARELKIVTGLGVYLLVSLCVVIFHNHNNLGMQYHWLDQFLVGCYLWTLSYWILASTTNVVEQQ
jgi:hypothetical protein